MAAGDLITTDWQIEFNDLLTGDLTDYDLRLIEGVGGMAAIRTADQKLQRRHGLHPGDDFLDGRTITLEYDVTNADHAARVLLLDALFAAFKPGEDELPLVFQIPSIAGGGKRRINCRPRRRAMPIDLQFLYSISEITLQLESTDPRIFDNTESTDMVSLPTAGGGLNFPSTFNRTFGAVSTGGTITANNAGTFDTPVVLRVDGPATDPIIENVTAGKTLELDIELGASDFIEFDTEERTVLLNGTASRYSLLRRSGWFDLAPGNNQLDFRAATTTAATLTATWRSAWS